MVDLLTLVDSVGQRSDYKRLAFFDARCSCSSTFLLYFSFCNFISHLFGLVSGFFGVAELSLTLWNQLECNQNSVIPPPVVSRAKQSSCCYALTTELRGILAIPTAFTLHLSMPGKWEWQRFFPQCPTSLDCWILLHNQ